MLMLVIRTAVKGLLFADIMWWLRWVEPFDCGLFMPQESHLHSATQQQWIETEERGESGVNRSEARRTRCLLWNGCPRLYKSTKKSFLFRGSIGHYNTRMTMTQQPVVGRTSTCGKFGVWGRPESGGIILWQQFLFCWYMWSSRGFDAEMSSDTRLRTMKTQQPHLEGIPSKWHLRGLGLRLLTLSNHYCYIGRM
jgi:hypothetical protein